MKPLIILIFALLCQFVNGQLNETFETYIDTANFSVYDIPEVDGLTFKHKEYVDAKITKFILSNWDEYSKECYADSTLKIDTSCPDKIPGCLVGHYREYYYHPKPDFPGFMNWLQNKVK